MAQESAWKMFVWIGGIEEYKEGDGDSAAA